jgi:hypothetical protein
MAGKIRFAAKDPRLLLNLKKSLTVISAKIGIQRGTILQIMLDPRFYGDDDICKKLWF